MNVCVSASWCILWHACRSGKAFGSWFSYFQCIFLGSNSGLKACMVGAFTKWAISPSSNAYYFSSFVIKVYIYAHVEVKENLWNQFHPSKYQTQAARPVGQVLQSMSNLEAQNNKRAGKRAQRLRTLAAPPKLQPSKRSNAFFWHAGVHKDIA